jgi:hypothetical protein
MQRNVHYIAWLHKTHILQAFASKWHILSCGWTKIPVCLEPMSLVVCVVQCIRKREKRKKNNHQIHNETVHHNAGKRTLHPNSTLLCHVHFLSSVLAVMSCFHIWDFPSKFWTRLKGYNLFCKSVFVTE